MDASQRKEQFSRAYVHAIATVAGFSIYSPEVDDDSVDLGIAGRGGNETCRSPRLELQLKCTSVAHSSGGFVTFRIKQKNFQDLRRRCWTPRILVVVVVPSDKEWIEVYEDRLIWNCRAYWVSLLGEPESFNRQFVTVHLPQRQRFTIRALRELMKIINRWGKIR